ncbi:MAG: hypothetical protein EOO46_16240 [Flavobacterium sp.]|nr:MAG: hypothetical protein EOO46_16240 [Flavobacterium sp.]
MEKILLLIFLSYFPQIIAQQKITYLDGNDKVITEAQFKITPKHFVAINDSLNIHKAVTNRSEKGNTAAVTEIYKRLNNLTPLDPLKPMVIIFYPGIDACNSSGSATKSSRRKWFKDLEYMINKIAEAKPIAIYKSKEGSKDYKGVRKWYKDPEAIIERTFFKYHYPCSSYVIIMPNGDYVAYFGEFGDNIIHDFEDIIK